MQEIPKHVFQQLIAAQKQSILIYRRQETYGQCYCVSYWWKTYKGASWDRAAAAHSGMLKPNDNDSTELSVGVKVFNPEPK